MNDSNALETTASAARLEHQKKTSNEIISKLNNHVRVQLESQASQLYKAKLDDVLVDSAGNAIKRWRWVEDKSTFNVSELRPELASIHDTIVFVEINKSQKIAHFNITKSKHAKASTGAFVIVDRNNIISSLTTAPISVELDGEHYEIEYPVQGHPWNHFTVEFLQSRKKLTHPHDRASYKRYFNEKAKDLDLDCPPEFEHPPQIKEKKSNSSESIKRLIEASRFEKSDIKDLLGISSGQLDSRLRGYTEFSFDEVKQICDLLEVSIDEAVRIGDMTTDEFENSWVYRWRRQNLERNIVRMEVEEKLSRSAIANKIGFSASWLSYVLNGKKRITSQASRQIEYALGMTSGALDTPPALKKTPSEINTDLLLKLTKELINQVKEKEGIEMHAQEVYSTIIAVSQLYNSLSSIKEGQLPPTDAIDFSKVYDTLVLHLKLTAD